MLHRNSSIELWDSSGSDRRLTDVQSWSAGPPTSRRNDAPPRTGGQCQQQPSDLQESTITALFQHGKGVRQLRSTRQ